MGAVLKWFMELFTLALYSSSLLSLLLPDQKDLEQKLVFEAEDSGEFNLIETF